MAGRVDQTGTGRIASSAEVRQRLLEVAAHMVREQGAPALSARNLAAATGTSTMAIYTHFGGMPGLVRAMVAEGFRRLFERVAAVPITEDPLLDLRNAAAAYRAHARADPDLYARDPGGFDRLMQALDRARAEKEAAELRWLELAEQVEAMA